VTKHSYISQLSEQLLNDTSAQYTYRPFSATQLRMEVELKIQSKSIKQTRKLSCRKDDRAMHPMYGCPENFR